MLRNRWILIATSLLPLGVALAAADEDADLDSLYRAYQSGQQATQSNELSAARAAALAGRFGEAEGHLAIARNLAHAPAEIAAVQQLINEEKSRRERLAREEQERKERAAQVERERQSAEAALRQERNRVAADAASMQRRADCRAVVTYRNTDSYGNLQISGKCGNNGGHFSCSPNDMNGQDWYTCAGPRASTKMDFYEAANAACGCD